MHELSICQDLMSAIAEAAHRHGARRVVGVHLRIGRLAGVVPELLEEAFVLASRDTVADGAALRIEPVELAVRCGDCGGRLTLDEPVFICPACGSRDLHVVGGRELELTSIEVDEDGADDATP
jgi:hydrogenase nickel incorporation protein HypA/HybF